MGLDGRESTWESIKYGKFVSQFRPDIKDLKKDMLTKIVCNIQSYMPQGENAS